MAKKGKMKISKLKHNNHTTNKMRKQGAMKLQRHRPKVQKQKGPPQPQIEYSSDSDSASGEDWADMLDEEEQAYIMNRIAKDSKLLSSVPQEDVIETKTEKPKKRKRQPKQQSDSGAETDSDASVEGKYKKQMAEQPTKKMRALLPIKSKEGLVEREVEDDDDEPESEHEPDQENKQTKMDQSESEDSDSGMEVTEDEKSSGGEVTTVQLMAERKDMLNKEKLRIGALCSSLIESPEKKLKNFFPILYLMEEQLKDGTLNMHSIRKIATLSAFEVFKDILPDYMIRHQDYSNIKLKKDTLTLYKFEKELLEFYKRYLQRLEKATAVLRPKKGDTRKPDTPTLSLALISLRCMCGLLAVRPQFNYATNIAQSVVPLLGCRMPNVRDMVSETCSQIFKEDKKGEITLNIVRLINQLVKKRGDRLTPSALHCLLDLRIKNVELDEETDLKHKQKQDEKHKKRIVNLSKKEKKRAKKLKEVERELLETQAQESEIAHKKQMTEVTKTVFHIYFRILKNSPHSKLLSAVLEGLAKFTHVINLEYYTELLAILAHLMSDDQIGRRERLLCVKTALSILAGSGDALNVDPARFHAYLYEHMIWVCSGKSHKDTEVVLNSVHQICRRVRQVSSATLQAMSKRIATMTLQMNHNGTLAGLLTLYNMAQQSKQVHSLFDATQESIGSGKFDPFLPSPEHCNAHSAILYELASLSRHYHPLTRTMASGLLAEPISMPQEVHKMNPMQVLKSYDGSQMCFKPAIPPPKPVTNSSRLTANHVWKQTSLKELCDSVERQDVNVNFSDLLKR